MNGIVFSATVLFGSIFLNADTTPVLYLETGTEKLELVSFEESVFAIRITPVDVELQLDPEKLDDAKLGEMRVRLHYTRNANSYLSAELDVVMRAGMHRVKFDANAEMLKDIELYVNLVSEGNESSGNPFGPPDIAKYRIFFKETKNTSRIGRENGSHQ